MSPFSDPNRIPMARMLQPATAHEEPMQLIACGHGEPRMVGGSLGRQALVSSGENFIAGDVSKKTRQCLEKLRDVSTIS